MQASLKTCYQSARINKKIKEGVKMTIEALKEAIAKLITKRAEAHGDTAEQCRINAKLSKLYDIKALALEQASRN